MVLKLPVMLPLWTLLSPMLTKCEVWAMVFYPECWLSVEMGLWFVGEQGEFMYSATRTEEKGAMRLVMAQLLSVFPIGEVA